MDRWCIVSLLLCVALTGCGGKSKPNATTADRPAATDDIAQLLVRHDAPVEIANEQPIEPHPERLEALKDKASKPTDIEGPPEELPKDEQPTPPVEKQPEPEPPREEPAKPYANVYIVVWDADWCSYCKDWMKDERQKLKDAGIDVTPLDLDSNLALATRHKITFVPAFQICTRDDLKVKKTLQGYQSAESLIEELKPWR